MICFFSTQGDGIVFKHRALVVFKNNITSLSSIPIVPSRDYDIHQVASDDDDAYPHMFPLKMAMLIAQHSASIPDVYSITYTPSSKWNDVLFGSMLLKNGSATSLMLMGMGGKKRKRYSDTTPSSSTISSPRGCGIGIDIACHNDVVPTWVFNGFINAVHRASIGADTFSIKNFRQEPANLDERGKPEIAQIREYAGDSFAVRKAPCIVSAAIDGIVSVHKGNKSYMWIAKTAKTSGEKLMYMKCWDPDCQVRTKDPKNRRLFDIYGWALLDKNSMSIIDGHVN